MVNIEGRDRMRLPVGSLHALGDTIKSHAEALRLRAQLFAAPTPPPDGAAASAAEIDALVEHQLGPWHNVGTDSPSLIEAFRNLNETAFSTFIFEVKAGRISVWEKPASSFPPAKKSIRELQMRTYTHRKTLYRIFLQAILARYGIDADMTLAIDTMDRWRGHLRQHIGAKVDFPLFAFQKDDDSRNILLPDVDFFHWSWYTRQRDDRRYEDKAIKACFVGSSTGGKITERTIAELSLPRLRAAAHFLDSPLVDFRIANAVQCKTSAAKALLERQRYFSKPMTWREQLGHRFLIAIDGNGVPCSRLVIGLKSHSVLMKYRSNFSLYYFPAMVAGRDYIDIAVDRDVEDAVDLERQSPGHFKPVADGGRAFAVRYLNPMSVADYTGALLRGYARIFNG